MEKTLKVLETREISISSYCCGSGIRHVHSRSSPLWWFLHYLVGGVRLSTVVVQWRTSVGFRWVFSGCFQVVVDSSATVPSVLTLTLASFSSTSGVLGAAAFGAEPPIRSARSWLGLESGSGVPLAIGTGSGVVALGGSGEGARALLVSAGEMVGLGAAGFGSGLGLGAGGSGVLASGPSPGLGLETGLRPGFVSELGVTSAGLGTSSFDSADRSGVFLVSGTGLVLVSATELG